jgi:hypothetical protein
VIHHIIEAAIVGQSFEEIPDSLLCREHTRRVAHVS